MTIPNFNKQLTWRQVWMWILCKLCECGYYVNLVYNFNLNAHYHIYNFGSLWFLPLTWQWPARKLSLLWPLCTYFPRSWLRPSAEDVSAFHRTQKNLWYPGSISTCVIIYFQIIVSTKLHPVNRVKNKVEVDYSHYRLFTVSNCSALQWMILNFGWWIADCELMWILYRIIPVFKCKSLFVSAFHQTGYLKW